MIYISELNINTRDWSRGTSNKNGRLITRPLLRLGAKANSSNCLLVKWAVTAVYICIAVRLLYHLQLMWAKCPIWCNTCAMPDLCRSETNSCNCLLVKWTVTAACLCLSFVWNFRVVWCRLLLLTQYLLHHINQGGRYTELIDLNLRRFIRRDQPRSRLTKTRKPIIVITVL